MTTMAEFKTAADFWKEMVEPDYEDFLAEPGSLRRALHLANSLFHMADWVFHSHEAYVRQNFSFADTTGRRVAVHDELSFANSLEEIVDDFARIRGIANAGKHLELRSRRPVTNAPISAANTKSISTGYGEGGYGEGSYGGAEHVVLEGQKDMEFGDIAKNVLDMWKALKSQHGW